MNIKTDLTAPECAKIRALCNFTPDEAAVFDLRVRAASVVEIQMALHMSAATVNRRLRGIKNKIARTMQDE